MKIDDFTYPSATGVCDISASSYLPDDGAFDTVLVINHGMAEHRERYLGFIEFLTGNGVAVYMHDMANHGRSNQDFAETGWFGEIDGWKGLVEDLRANVLKAKEENPGKKLIVMGHSMGSFLCRIYTAEHPEDGFDGAIYMGTGGPNPLAAAGDKLSSLIGAVCGKKHKSKLLDKITFSAYSKPFEHRTNFDWLTRDTAIVDQYVADPYCGFLFTTQGMNDLVQVNVRSNTDEWFATLPKDLNILLIGGAMDPVGDFSKGVDAVAAKLAATGHENVKTKLYPDCRHEVLNELNRNEVMADLLAWIESF